ncbi:hypothetical protein FACS1894172_01850 [Spirochaetia bacterium]|nr:hypothetical protein FACS1894172_01850 [Spirochaetia bacterium]
MVLLRKAHSVRFSIFLVLMIGCAIFTIFFVSISRIIVPSMIQKSKNEYQQEQRTVIRELFEEERLRSLALAKEIAIKSTTVDAVRYGMKLDSLFNVQRNDIPADLYGIDYVLIKDRDEKIIYLETYNYDQEQAIPDGLSESLNSFSRKVLNDYIMNNMEQQTAHTPGISGIILYEKIPYLLTCMPVAASLNDIHPVGTLLFISLLDNKFFQDLTHYKTVNFQIFSDIPVKSNAASLLLEFPTLTSGSIFLESNSDETWYTEEQTIIEHIVFSMIVASVILFVVLYIIISIYFIMPIEHLAHDISKSCSNNKNTRLKNFSTYYEFQLLTQLINTMLDKLEESSISLTTFEDILNGIRALIFVIDKETDEVLFVNNMVKRDYHIDDTAIGKKCWKVLQCNMHEPCPSCHLRTDFKDSGFHYAEIQSTLSNRYYGIDYKSITWGSHQAFLQHGVDIHDLKIAEFAMKKRFEQQKVLSAISQNFLSQESAAPIEEALMMTGMSMKVSRISLAQFSKTSQIIFNYEWRDSKMTLNSLLGRSFYCGPGELTYDSIIVQGTPYVKCSDITEMTEMVEKLFDPSGIYAFLDVPIFIYGKIWGIICIDVCTGPREWDEDDIQLIRLVANSIAGFVVRNRVEEQLIQTSSIINSSPQYITCLKISDCSFIYVNPGTAAMTGYSVEELMESGQDILFDDEINYLIRTEYIPSVLENRILQIDLQIHRKDGSIPTFSFTLFIIGDRTDILGIIAIDITERRRLSDELISAKEIAEQSSHAKSSFLTRMSHEMRTPMNAIIGMTTIAQNTQDAEKIHYSLTRINEASIHLLGVINDILDMSKIEAGKFELSYSEFNFEKMLIRVTDVMNFRIEEKHQNFIITMDHTLPPIIISDEQRLAQVITNLLSNAVKFTPEEGKITMTVADHGALTTTDGTMHRIRISVTDTGIGIAKDQQKKLFSLFEQADGSIVRKFGGTGLGLAISKNIVEMMGGSIWIDSELGQGSTFNCEITVPTLSQYPETIQPVDWEKLRILVVDDSPDILEYFQYFAEKMHTHCKTASNGLEAYQLMEDSVNESGTPFDIVFVDWKMPVMNGIELSKRIKEHFQQKSVVIMISGFEWETIKDEAHNAGVDGFVPKPLFPSAIIDCVNRYFASSHSASPEKVDESDNVEGIFEGRHVLLAEDVEINREIVFALLEDTKVTMDYAENGIEVLSLFKENPESYDLILMDISMPEMDGFEASEKIRALPFEKAQKIPIIAMTANVFREDIEKCLASGMNDHVGKPIDMEDLMKKLKKHLLNIDAA